MRHKDYTIRYELVYTDNICRTKMFRTSRKAWNKLSSLKPEYFGYINIYINNRITSSEYSYCKNIDFLKLEPVRLKLSSKNKEICRNIWKDCLSYYEINSIVNGEMSIWINISHLKYMSLEGYVLPKGIRVTIYVEDIEKLTSHQKLQELLKVSRK